MCPGIPPRRAADTKQIPPLLRLQRSEAFFRQRIPPLSQSEGGIPKQGESPEPKGLLSRQINSQSATNTFQEKVSQFRENLDTIRQGLHERINSFRAGQIREHLKEWKTITRDPVTLSMVEGVSIDFTEIPTQNKPPYQPHFSVEQTDAINTEIKQLQEKGVVVECEHTDAEFISPIFVRLKKDNKLRMILNLKHLNDSVDYHYFKIENLKDALALATQNCWFASLDLKDAYCSVHINDDSQNFLKFKWQGKLYKFTAFPNGLACCPRLFTKLLKPVMAYLHQSGFLSTVFIDDTMLFGNTVEECIKNVISSLNLFEKLGFVVHPEKSVLSPTQEITYLGFVINSVTMTVALTQDRKEKILTRVTHLLDKKSASIRELAKLIGMIVASFHGVMYGPLWYRGMERDKNAALRDSKGDYEGNGPIQ